MPIIPNFNDAEFAKQLQKRVIEIEKSIIKALTRLGEDCVKMSRLGLNIDPSAFPIDYGDDEVKKPLQTQGWVTAYEKHTKRTSRSYITKLEPGEYLDRTANLRSSIGYIVTHNGIIVSKNFQGSASGTNQGLSYAQEIAAEQPKGFALIVVAGMKYAVHVEAKGYNVIASAEKYAKEHIVE